jgi:hypothetical protein
MKTDAEIREILGTVRRVFQRNNKQLFDKEYELFWDHAFGPNEEALQRQASSEAEKAVTRLFDRTVRPLFSDLEKIAAGRFDDPIEWAREETTKMVRELLVTISNDPRDWFVELFQKACFERLQWLVDDSRVARAKMPATNQPGPLPVFDSPLRRAIRDILLQKKGTRLSPAQIADMLEDARTDSEPPDETWKDEKGMRCYSWTHVYKSKKLAQRLRNEIYKVRERLTDTHHLQ